MHQNELPISDNPPRESGQAFDWKKAQRGSRLLLEAMGLDPDSAPLTETWSRRVPATMETLSEGLREAEKPPLKTFETNTQELVVKTGIPLYSLCEHHLLPFHGDVHIAYCPAGEVGGCRNCRDLFGGSHGDRPFKSVSLAILLLVSMRRSGIGCWLRYGRSSSVSDCR